MNKYRKIQPILPKSSGYCLRSIARKPNQNPDIAPKSNQHLKINAHIHLKIGLKITHNGLKIASIHLKIEALRILYIETSITLKIDSKNRPTRSSKNRITSSKNRTRVLLKIARGRRNPGGAF
jgi:hypothetical protein